MMKEAETEEELSDDLPKGDEIGEFTQYLAKQLPHYLRQDHSTVRSSVRSLDEESYQDHTKKLS